MSLHPPQAIGTSLDISSFPRVPPSPPSFNPLQYPRFSSAPRLPVGEGEAGALLAAGGDDVQDADGRDDGVDHRDRLHLRHPPPSPKASEGLRGLRSRRPSLAGQAYESRRRLGRAGSESVYL